MSNRGLYGVVVLLVICLLVGMASVAQAGAVIELIPENPGPYVGGETFNVNVMVNQDPTGNEIYMRGLQFDFNASDPALALNWFAFDYEASQKFCQMVPTLCGINYAQFTDLDDPDGAIVGTFFTGTLHDNMSQMWLPGDGTALLYGKLEITLPTEVGKYTLDALNPGAPDPDNQGAQIRFGFGGADPITQWSSWNGLISGDPLAFAVGSQPLGPAELPIWHADSQVQLGWVFADPTNPQNSSPIPGWDKAIGAIPVWSYDANRIAFDLPAQWYIKIANLDNDNPVKRMWISWVYDFDKLAPPEFRIATQVDWLPSTGWKNLGMVDEWFDSAGRPTTDDQAATYGRFTWNLELSPNPESEEVWLGLFSNGYRAREVYIKTLCVEACEGDFDNDGDLDGSDLAVFAADFGGTDCCNTGVPPCEGDFNNDCDVDGSDLAIFAADFGRTDCPILP